jgi:hypothetical protein
MRDRTRAVDATELAYHCKHTKTGFGEPRPFFGPVARGDHQNRAAHGNVELRETCEHCGMQRRVLSNNGHYEHGPWFMADDHR